MTERHAAFFSYVHKDDEHENGQITRLHDLLQGEVRMQLGEDFQIFLDRDDITWGQQWRGRIDDSLNEVALLIPILTPSFFASRECRREVERFLERERVLGRDDLILPIYYVSAPQLDAPERHEQDPVARALAARQFADWRQLRFEPVASPAVRQRLAELAIRMRDSFWRPAEPDKPASPASPPDNAKDASGKPGVPATTATARVAVQRQEPPTLTVDHWGGGDHTTIGDAIVAAAPGTRILVLPGFYAEGLLIDKPLEILGQGPLQDVTVRATDTNVLMFKANIGRVANLTLQQAGGEFYAVDIAQGRLELEDCDISSRGLAVVGVHDGADPRLRRNLIHDCAQGGLFIYDQALGIVEDNEVCDTRLVGIQIKTGANPAVRRNRVHDCQQGGFFVNDNGLGVIEGNDVFRNGLSGINVARRANPTVRSNRVHDNRFGGIYVYESARGLFEGNDISGNGTSGINVSEGGDPTFRDNRVHDSREHGIFVFESGLGTFEDNEVVANESGVVVSDDGNPTFRRNRLNRNRFNGVWIRAGGAGTFEDNDMTDNPSGAWDIDPAASDELRREGNIE